MMKLQILCVFFALFLLIGFMETEGGVVDFEGVFGSRERGDRPLVVYDQRQKGKINVRVRLNNGTIQLDPELLELEDSPNYQNYAIPKY